MDRDINGAKNIFLKNFEALALELALGPTPCNLETDLLHGDRNVFAIHPTGDGCILPPDFDWLMSLMYLIGE